MRQHIPSPFTDLKLAVEGLFARLDDYPDEIRTRITDQIPFIGKFNPKGP
jgi:hypothetical protein